MNETYEQAASRLKSLSAQDWQSFGLHHLAYIRPVVKDGRKGYGVYDADGTLLGVQEREDYAALAAHHSDLTPLTVQ